MVYNNTTTLGTPVQPPPIVAELKTLFTNVPNDALLTALIGPTRRGPKGHPPQVLWHCFLAKYILGLPSTEALIRILRNNPFISQACGIACPEGIPHKSTLSRFFAKLTRPKYLHLVKDVSRALVRRHYQLPGFGKRVSLDSTTLKAWSNGGKTPKADPQAGWSIKQGTQGTKEMTYAWKLHLLTDCEYDGFPIAANISAGNVHDSKRASNVLSEARFTYSKFHPRFLMADSGYSSKSLLNLIHRQYRVTPLIRVNSAHKKMMSAYGKFMDRPEWKALYAQRQSVERSFSLLKRKYSLNHITVRGRRKITVHCYLSLIAFQLNFSGFDLDKRLQGE